MEWLKIGKLLCFLLDKFRTRVIGMVMAAQIHDHFQAVKPIEVLF